jgi:uncharacterized OsmC-like protein
MTMGQETEPTLRERQSRLKRGYREHPASAMQTSAVTSVTEEGDDPTRVRIAVEGLDGAVIEIAAHHAVGGTHALPCSGDVFLAALAGCQEITLRMVAAAIGIPLRHLAVRLEGDWDARGTLGVDREIPVGFQALRMRIEVATDASEEQLGRLMRSAERYCVIASTLRDAPPVDVAWSITAA